MSDYVPGLRDTKIRKIQRVENRGKENFSLNSLCVNLTRKKKKTVKRDILFIATLFGIEKD